MFRASKNGVIEDKDVALLQDFKARIDKTFANKLNGKTESISTDGAATAIDVSTLDCSYKLKDNENVIKMTFDEKQKVSAITLREDITQSRRVEEFKIYAKTAAGYLKIYEGTVIGSEKICLINPLLVHNTDEIKIVFTQSRSNPVIRTIEAFEK